MTAILVFKCTEGAGVGDYSPLAPQVVLTLMQDAGRNEKRSISMEK